MANVSAHSESLPLDSTQELTDSSLNMSVMSDADADISSDQDLNRDRSGVVDEELGDLAQVLNHKTALSDHSVTIAAAAAEIVATGAGDPGDDVRCAAQAVVQKALDTAHGEADKREKQAGVCDDNSGPVTNGHPANGSATPQDTPAAAAAAAVTDSQLSSDNQLNDSQLAVNAARLSLDGYTADVSAELTADSATDVSAAAADFSAAAGGGGGGAAGAAHVAGDDSCFEPCSGESVVKTGSDSGRAPCSEASSRLHTETPAEAAVNVTECATNEPKEPGTLSSATSGNGGSTGHSSDQVSDPAPQSSAEVSDPAPQSSAEVSDPAPQSSAEVSDPAPQSSAEVSDPCVQSDEVRLSPDRVASTLKTSREEVSVRRDLEMGTEDPRTNGDGWLDVVGNGQLKKKVLKAGVGSRDDRPKRGQLVTLRVLQRHLASSEDTTTSSSISNSGSDQSVVLQFGVGDGEVVAGLDLVVGLMQSEEVAEIRMAAKFGYGSKGLQEEGIPANSDLVYVVQLDSVEPEPLPEELSCQQRLKIGNSKRERGNWWFQREEYSHAIQCYRRALDFLDSDSDDITGLPDDVHLLLEQRLKVHNNMAAAQMKLLAYDSALRSLQLVINCQPTNVKALYRKSKLLIAQEKWKEAEVVLRRAIEVEPNNRVIRAELHNITSLKRREEENERKLYSRMCGNTADKKSVAKTRSSVVTGLVFGGFAIGVLAAIVYRFKSFQF